MVHLPALRFMKNWEQTMPCTMMSRLLLAVVIVGALLATSPVQATDLSGHWSGSWRSCTSSHKGPLRAKFCAINDSQYRVEFTGRFLLLLPFRYEVTLNVVSDDGETVQLAGSSYLGRLFGTFHYRAQATPCRFTASYCSGDDRGLFILHRTCHGR